MFTSVKLTNSSQMVIKGSGGTPGGAYRLLRATNITGALTLGHDQHESV